MDEKKQEAPSVDSPPAEVEGYLSPSATRSLLRKLDLHLLPALTLLYLLSFLDRSNVANARIEGLADQTGMTGDDYLSGLTLYFVGYVVFEIPCNIVLKRTSPRAWLPTLTLVWGVVATLMGLVENLSGFFAVRFILGATESGLFPGVVFYLSMWYCRNERHYRVALFYSAASLAGAFGGILAYGIAFMDGAGGLAGWRWIFILEGLITVAVSFLAYFFIHNYPDTAKFLSDDERAAIHARLKADSDAMREERFNWHYVSQALIDPKCWLYGAGFHTLSLPMYTLSLFLPTIIKELGFTAAQAQLLTIPPYAVATTLTIAVAVASERTRSRAPFIVATSLLAAIGYVVLLTQSSAWPAYGGTILAAAGIYPSVALTLAWPATNVSGQTKRATANAMQISIGNIGAMIGTQLYRTEWAPRFFVGNGVALGYLLGNVAVTAALWWLLTKENKRRDALGAPDSGEEREFEGDKDITWRFQT